MKRVAIAALVTACGSARADPEEVTVPAPPVARGTQLVRADAKWRWQVVTTPRIARQIGALAISGLDVAAGRAATPIDVFGDGHMPRAWPYDVEGDRREIGKPGDGERIAVAFGVTTFRVAAGSLDEMLELRLHYEDGIAAWINGVEVARQALPRGSVTAVSKTQHGPEWETFYIPIAPGLLKPGDNTLAIEVHPAVLHAAPVLAADLIARRDRGIVRGPVLADATQTSMTIAVDTDPNVDAVIEWGTGDASDRRDTSPAGRHHVFKLTGLSPNTRYGYRIHAGATQTPRYELHTLPPAGAVLRLGVYGDVRGGHAVHRRIAEHMLGEGLDAVAVTGDMVLHGSDEADWQRFFTITSELLAQVPYFPAVGNHDLGWDGADGSGRAQEMFQLPAPPPGRPDGAYYYSRDLSDVHFVFLDSNAYERGEQESWLDADLAAARKRGVRAILAFTHDGPYSRGYHGGSAIARTRYVPILVRHHVDALFAGHDHLYQRGELGGLRYVVSGGGGASLYAIRCGVPNRPRCTVDDGMQVTLREHHYVVATIGKDLELCARKPDGQLLEKCTHVPLWHP